MSMLEQRYCRNVGSSLCEHGRRKRLQECDSSFEEERRLNVRSLEAAVYVNMAGRRDTTRNAGSSM
jgi:hypothetical protein